LVEGCETVVSLYLFSREFFEVDLDNDIFVFLVRWLLLVPDNRSSRLSRGHPEVLPWGLSIR
jgi:hypothetical protein